MRNNRVSGRNSFFMQYTIFSIPYHGDPVKEEELNLFLRSKKIVAVSKELISVDKNAFWSFCVRWLVSNNTNNKPQKIDYSKNLTKEEFIHFEQLKVIRKNVAKELGIPAYAVFTNKELNDICKLKTITAANVLEIDGIGKGRLDKIGESFFKHYEKNKSSV